MNIPSRVWSDDQIGVSCINGIISCLETMRLVGDPGSIMIDETPGGSVISAIRQPPSEDCVQMADSSAVFCKITGGSGEAGYTVDVYANGLDEESTGTGMLKALNMAFGGPALAAGTEYVAYPFEISVTGGNE